MEPQNPEEFQPFEIRRQAYAQTPARIGRDLADQQAAGKHSAIT